MKRIESYIRTCMAPPAINHMERGTANASSSNLGPTLSLTDLPTSSQNGAQCEQEKTYSEDEIQKLKDEIIHLRQQLNKSQAIIEKLQEKEEQYKEQIAKYMKNHIKTTGKFEDISLGDNRPSKLIKIYANLYSEARVEAYDALDNLPEIASFNDLKGKLLFSVIVLSFRSVNSSLNKLQNQLKHLLCIPEDTDNEITVVKELVSNVDSYLQQSADSYDVSSNIQEVCNQVYSTLYDYPSLKSCEELRNYITNCVRIAWALSVQTPPYVIKYDSQLYDEDLHTRFYTSDPKSNRIKMVIWPPLLEGKHGVCVHKGVVLT